MDGGVDTSASEIVRREAAARLRALPSVGRLLEGWAQAGQPPGARVADALRAVLAQARARAHRGEGEAPSEAELIAAARSRLAADDAPVLRRVINATGIAIHTNLGRAPLARRAVEAMAEVATGYANLEFDLDAGARGARTAGVEPLVCELTGAEAALAVNNAAAAVLLALSALAGGGGEVIVSRGELVEIGGGFRIPEVIAQGGARLVEVGSTNKTRLADYAGAVTERTRVLLKVHQSNFRVVGFTAEAGLAELAELARARGLVLMHDLGGGAMGDLRRPDRRPDRRREPTVRDSLAAGADVVAFSGDKLMGGPQAGVLAGRATAIDPMRRHPLLRAVRLDKATLAALEATLALHRDPDLAAREIPVLRMLAQDEVTLAARAERLARALAGAVEAEVVATEAFGGGGALPGEACASRAVAVTHPALSVDDLARRLRTGRPAVVGRIADGRLLLDLFAVADEEVEALAAAVRTAAGAAGAAAP